MPSRGVLVTGASRGIGRAIATEFAARGDRVAVHYSVARGEAERTLALLAGTGHVLVGGDVADPTEARRIVDQAVAGLGAVDVLVNNAGITPTADTRHPVDDVSYEQWRAVWQRTIEVNLLGAANVTWTVVQHLVSRGKGGAIVNVGSRGAFRGEPDNPAYGASKAALHAFGQSLAVALAPRGITVASVAPGFVSTDGQDFILAGPDGEEVRGQSPFGRVAAPEEVASAVLYLASPAARWSSGAVLDVNGASYLR